MKLLSATSTVLLLGVATLAVAQTTTQSFADQFRQMQSLQSVGTYTFKPAPPLGRTPQDPVGRESFAGTFARMQELSSSSGEFSPERQAPVVADVAADPVGRESFATAFARMQAASSNSGEWKLPGGNAPAYGAPVARGADQPMSAESIARTQRAPGGASSAAY